LKETFLGEVKNAGLRNTDLNTSPLHPWDDFFPGSDRFAQLDFRDISKWNKLL
jgi:hypothetical protein